MTVNRRLAVFKAELFKVLGHPTRIRILQLLRGGERTVSDLQASLGVEASSVSQQLSLLRAKRIVEGRKDGTSVYYRAVDPQVFALLDVARQILEAHLVDLQAMTEEESDAPAAPGPDAPTTSL